MLYATRNGLIVGAITTQGDIYIGGRQNCYSLHFLEIIHRDETWGHVGMKSCPLHER